MPIANQVGLESWSGPIGGVLVLAALLYVRGWFYLHLACPSLISVGRLATFLCGLFLVWIAVASPLATLDEQLLSVHMAQHLLLMTLAPPLILLGAPSKPFRHGFPAFMRRVLSPIRVSPAVQRLGRVLTAPLTCWLVATGVLIGWHFPAAYKLGLGSHSWHAIEHSSFFAAGILFWWPVIPRWPAIAPRARWSVVVYLFLATLPCDVLSAFLTFCDRVVYASYLNVPRRFNISALQDQQFAGTLMWIVVTFAYLIPAVFFTVSLLSTRGIEEQSSHSDLYEGTARQHISPGDSGD